MRWIIWSLTALGPAAVFLHLPVTWKIGAGCLPMIALILSGYGLTRNLARRRHHLKAAIETAQTPHLTHIATTPSRHRGLDLHLLDAYSDALIGLGFEVLNEFSSQYPATAKARARARATKSDSYARLFIHRQYGCLAQVYQLLRPNKSPLHCSMLTYFAEEWRLAHTTAQLAPGSRLRLPRKLSVSMPVGSSVAEMFHKHLSLRARLRVDLGIEIIRDLDFDLYINESERAVAARLQQSRQRSSGPLPQPLTSELPSASSHEWLGDYPQEAEKRRVTSPGTLR